MAEGTKDFVSRAVDFIFNIRGAKLYIILIFFLGFILRFIASVNLSVSADDMHFVTHAINFLSAGRLETYDQSAGLWFAFTDLMYKIFGYTQIGSRMASLIFGSLSILAIYLLSREFFDEKTSLFAALLIAISPFHIRLTIAEMDVMAMFFVILGMFIFVRAVKSEGIKYFAISGVLFGLAVYTKVYPLLFIPSLLLFLMYKNYKTEKKIIRKKDIKKIFVFLGVIFIFCIPSLTHNYLLYKEKGFLDLQFTRTTGLGKNISAQYYSWDAQFNAKNSWRGLLFGDEKHIASGTPLLLGAIDFIRVADPIAFYLGLLGLIILIFSRKEARKDYIVFFIASILFVLPFLASIILLPKHFVFLEILLIPFAGFFMQKANEKITIASGRNSKKILVVIIIISALILLGFPRMNTNTHFYGKSAVAQAIDFKNNNIPDNALIVGDGRIYSGQIHWIFQGRPYIEGADFIKILNEQENIPGDTSSVNVYYFECVKDDCGWGGIDKQQEFNATMESLAESFKRQGKLIKTISEPDRFSKYYLSDGHNRINTFNIYSANINLKRAVLIYASQPKEWFLYTVGYEPIEKQYDYYPVIGFPNYIFYKIARIVMWLSLILSFISIIYLIYILICQDFFKIPNLEHVQEPKFPEGS